MSKSWIKESISFKLVIIGVLVLLLLIPMQMIKNLIREREFTRNEVINEIGLKWANEQTINGPIITIPYKSYYEDDGKMKWSTAYAHFLAEELNINGQIIPQERYRGTYKSIVYSAKLSFTGSFKQFSFKKWNINPDHVMWENAYLSLGITDMRGISKSVNINFNNAIIPVDPGVRSKDIIKQGVSAPIVVNNENQNYTFSFDLNLRGSKSLNFIPTGKVTKVHLNSEWNSPSFNGSFLPSSRNISEDGFDADWQILHLNRNFPQQWLGSHYKVSDSWFGVDLILPVNQYLKSERAVKYAIMFIALTFLVFFFTEVINRKRIHPIQYLLVGFSLIIFYTLLLSLSEHINFDLAYLIAATAVISLITFYTKATINKRKTTLSVLGVLLALYVFLYTILQLEAYSLLMGSVGLFIALSLIMILSRKVDWNTPIKFEGKSS